MIERRRGIDRVPITEDEVEILSTELARRVKQSEWQPTTVVGIDFGGSEVGRIVAEQLECPVESILVRRRLVSLFDVAVARYPRLFIVAGVPAQLILSTMYHLLDPVVLRALPREIDPDEKVLLVDDSVGKGPTLTVGREHLLQQGAVPTLLKTAVIQVHQEFEGQMPDYYCMIDNRRFPWDKASLVYEYMRTGKKSSWADKRLQHKTPT